MRRRLTMLAAMVLLAGSCIRFDAPVSQPVAPDADTEVRGLGLGDFDGDGLDEVAVLTSDDHLVELQSCGGGCLEVTGRLSVAPAMDVLTTDVDGDGYDDVVLSDVVDHQILFGGAADGPRSAGLDEIDMVTSSFDGAAFAAADLNDDGYADLITAVCFEIAMMCGTWAGYGDGTGEFGRWNPFDPFPTNGQTLTVGVVNAGGPPPFAIGDFDGDGSTDVHVGSLTVRNPIAGDIDGDGLDDLAVVDDGDQVFWRSTGAGFEPFPAYEPLPDRVFALRDIDGDGLTDALATNGWFSGTGDGGFPYRAASHPDGTGWILGDIDGDGLDDAVTSSGGPFAEIDVRPNTSFLGD